MSDETGERDDEVAAAHDVSVKHEAKEQEIDGRIRTSYEKWQEAERKKPSRGR